MTNMQHLTEGVSGQLSEALTLVDTLPPQPLI